MEIRPIDPGEVTKVDVHEWDPNAEAYVKTLNNIDAASYYMLISQYWNKDLDPDERAEAGAQICVMCVVGKEGGPLLTADDIPTLKKASFKPYDRIIKIIRAQLGDEDEETGGKKG